MIEIREANGRYEVFSPDRHWEVFETKLRAQAAALGLAAEIQSETGANPVIITPWPLYPLVKAPTPTIAACRCFPVPTCTPTNV